MPTALPHPVACIAGMLLLTAAAEGRPDSVFDLAGERPADIKAWVTLGDSLPDSAGPGRPSSAMLLLLDGVLAELSPQEIALLSATPEPAGRLIDARGDLERVGVVHLVGRKSAAAVEVLIRPDGSMIARELVRDGRNLESEQQRIVRLNHRRFEEASADWCSYRGFAAAAPPGSAADAPPPAVPPGRVVELTKPYTPGRFIMDGETIGDRFQHGQKSKHASKRALSDEKLYIRLPREYDPRRPAGLLLWISSETGGEPPALFHTVADELNLICAGAANAGNLRYQPERYQLAFDTVATASERFHIDPRRVYVTGISGGGRTSGRLLACFPDVFTGAVPIVGLDTYRPVPLGNSRYAPAGYEKPSGKPWMLLKSRRFGAMTGGEDFNQPEIKGAAEIMNKDGLRVRLFDYKDMGHQMPSAERFAEALKWVDEPYQQQRKKEADQAAAALGAYVAKYGEVAPADDKQRAALVKVTEAGPWTEAAWRAAAMLGIRTDRGVK